MSPKPLDYLAHVLDEADFLAVLVSETGRESLDTDEVKKRAIVRSIEIVGEAVKKVPDDITERYPDIPWKLIAGMRDRLAHAYFSVDYDIVWDVAVNQMPTLRSQIQTVLEREAARDRTSGK